MFSYLHAIKEFPTWKRGLTRPCYPRYVPTKSILYFTLGDIFSDKERDWGELQSLKIALYMSHVARRTNYVVCINQFLERLIQYNKIFNKEIFQMMVFGKQFE